MGFGLAGRMKEGYSKLHQGMTKSEVIALLGEPTGRSCRGGRDTLKWMNREWKGMLRGGSIDRVIECDFEDDKLVGWDGQNIEMSRW